MIRESRNVHGLQDSRPLIASLLAGAALLLVSQSPAAEFSNVECEGAYSGHLQGTCVDDRAIYWCFTTTIVKTDPWGKVLAKTTVANHHGDLCYYKQKLYVAVNLGEFNNPQGKADSWIYVYDTKELELLDKKPIPEVVFGAGGIAVGNGRFVVVGGLPDGERRNLLYEYDEQLSFIRRHELLSGHTELGIQTASYADGRWWFGCYGTPEMLLVADEQLQFQASFPFSCSLGIVGLADGRFLTALGSQQQQQNPTQREYRGQAVVALPDTQHGLREEVWTQPPGAAMRIRRIRHCEGAADEIQEAVSQDGSVTARIEGEKFKPRVRLFKSNSPDALGPELQANAHRVTAIAIGSDNRTVAMAIGNLSNDWGQVLVWNGITGERLAKFSASGRDSLGEVFRLTFRSNDKLLDVVSGPAGGK